MLGVGVLLAFACAPVGAQGLYLHVIDTTVDARASLGAEESWPVALGASDTAALAERLDDFVPLRRVGDQVVIDLAPDVTLTGEPSAAHRQASFVVDFDEPAVIGLRASLGWTTSRDVSIEDLLAATDAAIVQKTYRRGFDFASRVATSREGDCTEHAVLLTALARAQNRPARVVIGFVLVANGREVNTYGHAWSEIHDGGRWVLADATAIGAADEGAVLRYVPIKALENEGPGYALDLMDLDQGSWITRVDLLAPEAASGSGEPVPASGH